MGKKINIKDAPAMNVLMGGSPVQEERKQTKEPVEKETAGGDGETASPIPTEIAPPPKGYKINPIYIETKTKRLQLVVKPSTYEKLMKRVKREKTSLNGLVNRILEDSVREDS